MLANILKKAVADIDACLAEPSTGYYGEILAEIVRIRNQMIALRVKIEDPA